MNIRFFSLKLASICFVICCIAKKFVQKSIGKTGLLCGRGDGRGKKKLEKELCCLIITEIDHISIKKLMCLISLLNYFVFSMHSLFLEHLFIAYDETLFIKMKLNKKNCNEHPTFIIQ